MCTTIMSRSGKLDKLFANDELPKCSAMLNVLYWYAMAGQRRFEVCPLVSCPNDCLNAPFCSAQICTAEMIKCSTKCSAMLNMRRSNPLTPRAVPLLRSQVASKM